ncbi:MAG: hypothetical protein RQ867_02025 [Mariprofundaceae bacterium]|nr:hypothetical protein [Mariprofundaceae bacterium]
MIRTVLAGLLMGITVFSTLFAHAGDVSLEELKRLLDESAKLSEPVAATEGADAPEAGPAAGIEHDLAALQRELAASENPLQSRRVLLDVRSNHSDGAHDMDMLAGLAIKRGIDTLVFGEHDRYTIRLGLDPVPQLIGISMQHPSLYQSGLEAFFSDLNRVRTKFPQLHVMAATESTPGYYWDGIPFRDLSLHEAERHLIALGIERPEQIEALPSYDLRNIRGNFMLSLTVWLAVIFLLLVALLRCRRRSIILLMLASAVAVVCIWLLQKQVDADADFINAAREQGLFVIWAHPGTLSGVREGPMGVQLDTPPYSRRVFEEPTADAFAAVYGDTDDNTVPGGMWDRFMMDYMLGYRPGPIWAVAAGDYHEEGQSREYLGNFPMDVWTKAEGSEAVMAALRSGRNTSWFMTREKNLKMAVLFLEAQDGTRLLPGDELTVGRQVKLHASLSEWIAEGESSASGIQSLQSELIVDGRVVTNIVLSMNDTVSVTPLELMPGPHVIRLRIPDQQGVRMEANPFLLHVKK